ncbi:MAG: hypothetical protein DME43_14950 [Verrucomicrobia bacterium]|nr:MAG: hypothetical protein DME43_14950 [Verrucomicrobiota bacterium]PYK71039.1 MAG: hypothetical protein DME44_09220 [Verrucomicrobiota bacterium]
MQSKELGLKPVITMKNLPRTIGYVLPLIALGAGIVVFSCADKIHSTGAAGKVTIQQSGILIRPGTQLSEGDQTAMNEILKSYDKSLYKIQTYENGQLKKTQGKLSDMYIDKATASEAAKAMTEKGSTQYVIQIGFLDKTHQSPTPPPMYALTDKTHKSPTPIPGVPNKTHQSPTPPAPTPSDKTHQMQQPTGASKEAEDLVKRLTPILEKYSGR